jgi:hypothetical protein
VLSIKSSFSSITTHTPTIITTIAIHTKSHTQLTSVLRAAAAAAHPQGFPLPQKQSLLPLMPKTTPKPMGQPRTESAATRICKRRFLAPRSAVAWQRETSRNSNTAQLRGSDGDASRWLQPTWPHWTSLSYCTLRRSVRNCLGFSIQIMLCFAVRFRRQVFTSITDGREEVVWRGGVKSCRLDCKPL